MSKCPIENCGRFCDSYQYWQEHVARRHEKYLPNLAQIRARENMFEHATVVEINSLPKIKQPLKHSKIQEQMKPVEVYRKSSSKGKPKVAKTIEGSTIQTVIAGGRSEVGTSESGSNPVRRPKSIKKSMNPDRLPQLNAGKQSKLQILGAVQGKNSQQQEERNKMSITAPHFHPLKKTDSGKRQKTISRGKKDQSYLEDDSVGIKNQSEGLIGVKTQQGFYPKEKGHHHPIRNIVKRGSLQQRKKTSKVQDEEIRDEIVEEKPKQQIIPSKVEAKKQEQPSKPVKQVIQPKQAPKRTIQPRKDTKKPIKRQLSQKKGEKQYILDEINFNQRTVVIKNLNSARLSIPSDAKCEYLFANNLTLSSINLHNIQTLRQLSLTHNSLRQLSFLNYPNNHHIQKLYIDHNQLELIDYLPPNLKVFSATFNRIQELQTNARELGGVSTLQEVDFTFNPIRNEPNYKLHVMSACLSLKKIDGIRITKFDLELVAEYARMVDEEMGLIPSSKFQNLVVSKFSNSPSTVISYDNQPEEDESGMGYEELQREIVRLQKIVKTTEGNMRIIKKENEVMGEQVEELRGRCEESSFGNEALYQKLRKECQALQLLNFMQYASEEELAALISKKQQEVM